MSFSDTSGILMPEEVALVQDVYSKISSEDWFTRSPERREQFAGFVIDLYRRGVHDRDNLVAQSRSEALALFGNGGFR
jgi:hypothetical protein